MDITLYLVGTDKDDAQGNMPFDGPESATSYMDDNPGNRLFTVTARIDFATIEEV